MAMGSDQGRKPLLGLILEKEKILSESQVRGILSEQRRRRESGQVVAFGQMALEMRYLNDRQLAKALQLQSKLAVPPGEPKRLGYYLMEAGIVTPSQLLAALEHQAAQGGKLGEILIGKGALTETMLEMFLTMQRKEREAQAAGG